MQTLVYSTPYLDDRIDLRNLVGKDQGMSAAEAGEKSDYVLFAPGSILAPPAIRAEGRTVVKVTDEIAEHLLTHPTWYFRTEADHDAHDKRARQRAADQLGPVVAERMLGGVNVGAVPPETAPQTPADPQAVMMGAAEQARIDAQTAKERADQAKADAEAAAQNAKDAQAAVRSAKAEGAAEKSADKP